MSPFTRRMILVAASLALAGTAAAQSDRPIKLVVPFAPGGGTDIVARFIAEKMAAKLSQPVIVDNKPGANGAIAGEAVKIAPADGLTLLVATAASFAAAPALGAKLPYDVEKDFTPVAMLGLFPLVINAATNVPAKSLQDVARLAREKPGALNYATAGVGSTNHLVWEMVAEKAGGLKLTHVPYKGAAQAGTDLLSGQVQVMVDSLAASLPNIKAGKVTPLAVTTAQRQPQAPDVPTLKESGVDLIYPGWASVVAPAGTPAAAVERVANAINEVLRAPDTVERYRQLVIDPATMSPAETGAFMAADRNALTALVKKAGIKLEE